jgi:hypothetical protein
MVTYITFEPDSTLTYGVIGSNSYNDKVRTINGYSSANHRFVLKNGTYTFRGNFYRETVGFVPENSQYFSITTSATAYNGFLYQVAPTGTNFYYTAHGNSGSYIYPNFTFSITGNFGRASIVNPDSQLASAMWTKENMFIHYDDYQALINDFVYNINYNGWLSDSSANRFKNTYITDVNNEGFAMDMSGDLVIRGNINSGAGTINCGTIEPAFISCYGNCMIDQVPSDNATYGLCVKGFGGNYVRNTSVNYGAYDELGNSDITLLVNAISTNNTLKIYTDGKIAGQAMFAFSDRRIKNNIIEINDQSALDSLRLLKPCTYNYKDVIDRGYGKVTGFIAQEVHDVLPNSVDLITSEIPNIYRYGIFKVIDDENAEILCDSSFNMMTDLEKDASGNIYERLKFFDILNNTIYVEIVEVIDEKTLKVHHQNNFSIDASGTIAIYGQEVKNFYSLKKDAIYTTTTAALQEVDRQLQAEKAKTADLESKTAALEAQVAALLAKYPID